MKSNLGVVDAPIHTPESDYHLTLGSYFPPQFKIVGFFFCLAGITLCIQLNLLGLLLLSLGLISILAKKALTFSFSLSRFRYSFVLFKYHIGKWESLPDFESISIFSAKKKQDMSTGSQMGSASFSEIEVNLVHHRSRRLTVFTSTDFSKALKIAQFFAKKLDLRIYNATEKQGYWLDEQALT